MTSAVTHPILLHDLQRPPMDFLCLHMSTQSQLNTFHAALVTSHIALALVTSRVTQVISNAILYFLKNHLHKNRLVRFH